MSPGRVFLLALLLRVAAAALVFHLNPERMVGSAASHGGDAWHYELLAVNLLEHGVYSRSLAAPYAPDMWRVPGYPAFLAAAYALGGRSPAAAVAWQIVIGAATCALLYRLAGRLTGSHRVAVWAGLLLAVDPAALLAALELMSETLFTLLLLLHVDALWSCRQGARRGAPLRAGLWLGLAGLVRSEALGLALLEAPMLLRWSGAARAPLALLLATALPVLPWLGRNTYHFQVPALASVSTHTLLFTTALLVREASEGGSRAAIQQDFRRQLAAYRHRHGLPGPDHPGLMAPERQLALGVLARHPGTYLGLQLKGSPGLLLPPVLTMVRTLGYPRAPFAEPWTVWLREGWPGMMRQLRAGLAAALPWAVLIAVALWGAFQAAVYLAAGAGLVSATCAARHAVLAILCLPVLYFGVIVQATVLPKTPRHLVPLAPYLAVAAGLALGGRSPGRRAGPLAAEPQ